MTRVTLLTEIPAPYRIPLFNALAERIDLSVLFLRDRNPDRPYNLHADELRFDWSVLAGMDVTVGDRWLVVNRGIARALRGSHAVVVGGWNQPAFWTALAWCRMCGVPALLWSESTGPDRRSGRHEQLKRAMLRVPSGFVVPGVAAREYLERLGVSASRITIAPNAVDPAIFASASRTRTGGPVRIIAVGRLAPEKGIDTLLDAVHGLPVDVVLAGIGPEEDELRRAAGSNVSFLGHVARDALPLLYADADVLVLPSRSEPWGMTLNEGALAGLPLVASTAAGAARELIEDGANGFVVRPDDPDALRSALQRLLEDEAFRRAAGARSREIASRFTPEAWAEATAVAIHKVAR